MQEQRVLEDSQAAAEAAKQAAQELAEKLMQERRELEEAQAAADAAKQAAQELAESLTQERRGLQKAQQQQAALATPAIGDDVAHLLGQQEANIAELQQALAVATAANEAMAAAEPVPTLDPVRKPSSGRRKRPDEEPLPTSNDQASASEVARPTAWSEGEAEEWQVTLSHYMLHSALIIVWGMYESS